MTYAKCWRDRGALPGIPPTGIAASQWFRSTGDLASLNQIEEPPYYIHSASRNMKAGFLPAIRAIGRPNVSGWMPICFCGSQSLFQARRLTTVTRRTSQARYATPPCCPSVPRKAPTHPLPRNRSPPGAPIPARSGSMPEASIPIRRIWQAQSHGFPVGGKKRNWDADESECNREPGCLSSRSTDASFRHRPARYAGRLIRSLDSSIL